MTRQLRGTPARLPRARPGAHGPACHARSLPGLPLGIPPGHGLPVQPEPELGPEMPGAPVRAVELDRSVRPLPRLAGDFRVSPRTAVRVPDHVARSDVPGIYAVRLLLRMAAHPPASISLSAGVSIVSGTAGIQSSPSARSRAPISGTSSGMALLSSIELPLSPRSLPGACQPRT